MHCIIKNIWTMHMGGTVMQSDYAFKASSHLKVPSIYVENTFSAGQLSTEDIAELDVLGSFRQYVVQNEERMQGLKDQISTLESAVRVKSAAVHQAKIEIQSSEGYQGRNRTFFYLCAYSHCNYCSSLTYHHGFANVSWRFSTYKLSFVNVSWRFFTQKLSM